MNLHPMSAHLDSLAWHIDRFGYDAITQQHLRDLRQSAEQAGVRQGLIDLMTDETAPAPVRGRAFGRIASLLTARFRDQQTPATDSLAGCSAEQVACAA